MPLPLSQRSVAFLTTLALALALLITGAAAAKPAGATSSESAVTSKINSVRAARGVHRLVTRSDLVRVARAQAQRMAVANRLYHNPRLARDVRNYRWAGENVGYGPDVAKVHNAFMASPGHKANVLDRDYTEVGVGAVWANGRVWIAEVFRRPLHAAKKRVSKRPVLHYGDSGPAVKKIQRRLGVRATGWFGPQTRAKVKRLQHRKGWRTSGIVGRGVWRALGY